LLPCAQVAALSRWQLSSFELSDVLWALASSRHWCPLLGQLETSLMAAGGPAACSAPELITMLWSFATLSHTPKQLLAELDAQGWCVRPSSELPAAQRSSLQQQQQKRTPKAAKQQQQQDEVASNSSSSSTCRLSELSGSQLSALVWSLACLQQADSALFKQAWVEVCRRGPSLASDTRQLVRIHQASLAVQLEASYSPTELYCDAGALLAHCRAAGRCNCSTLWSLQPTACGVASTSAPCTWRLSCTMCDALRRMSLLLCCLG
jgi:hypothetical protein